MKTIGLIGGMSWESSAEYYRIINEEVKQRLGALHSAKCILYSVDFEEIERYQAEGNWKKAGETLAEVAHSVEKAGADFIVICTNTMHKVISYIEEKVRIPVLHIADATAKKIHEQGIKSVALLGTKYTMEDDFYTARLEASGLHVIIPSEYDREIVNRVIYEELCVGSINEIARSEYKRVIQSLIEEGAGGIILGCTEIGLLITEDDSSVPLFDTAYIHATEAIMASLK